MVLGEWLGWSWGVVEVVLGWSWGGLGEWLRWGLRGVVGGGGLRGVVGGGGGLRGVVGGSWDPTARIDRK